MDPSAEREQISGECAENGGHAPDEHHQCQDKGSKDFKWYTQIPEEEPHALAGRIVKRLGIFAYLLFVVVPLLFAAIVFAIIPLGNPTIANIDEQWVFLFISNLLVNAVYCFLYTAAFLASVPRERPFRVSLWPFVAVIAVQLAIFTPVLLLHGVFDYLGLVAFVVFFLSLFVSLFVVYPEHREKLQLFFRRFVLLLAFYVPILVAYLIGYREGGSAVQVVLSVSIAFVTFIYRRSKSVTHSRARKEDSKCFDVVLTCWDLTPFVRSLCLLSVSLYRALSCSFAFVLLRLSFVFRDK